MWSIQFHPHKKEVWVNDGLTSMHMSGEQWEVGYPSGRQQ